MKYATPTTIDELERLFEVSPPNVLKDRLMFVFFQYLATTKGENLHPEFNQMSEDFYSLFRFLDEAENREETTL